MIASMKSFRKGWIPWQNWNWSSPSWQFFSLLGFLLSVTWVDFLVLLNFFHYFVKVGHVMLTYKVYQRGISYYWISGNFSLFFYTVIGNYIVPRVLYQTITFVGWRWRLSCKVVKTDQRNRPSADRRISEVRTANFQHQQISTKQQPRRSFNVS